ncbi:hypothetical protein NDU88_002055 [Pleurodeles waltl]|uniref:Uncharacterized protein n=1 Tax=Pleurodeles waltl TaxID=8319 RepID=A0AAV7UA66_PLEWA|nr:hypothetical protein NDU88_002055 [Pleurodeles waltl]
MWLANQGPKVTRLGQKSPARSHICYNRMLEHQENGWRPHSRGLELVCSYGLSRSLTGRARSELQLEKCRRVTASPYQSPRAPSCKFTPHPRLLPPRGRSTRGSTP